MPFLFRWRGQSDLLYSIILRVIHVTVVIIIVHLFLATTEYYSIVWIYYNLLIHSPADGYLRCFKFLVIADKATVNIHAQIFVWTYVFGRYLVVEWLSYAVGVFLLLLLFLLALFQV